MSKMSQLNNLAQNVMRDTQQWKEGLDRIITKPIEPQDASWDCYGPPSSLYILVTIYVIVALCLGPPLFRYRPLLPLHVAFFTFNLATLISNFCIFMNALVVFYSRTTGYQLDLLALVFDPHGKTIINLTWVHCAFRVFEFLGEALLILHHKHDNFRVLRITYFLICLINIWRQLRFGSASFFSLSNFYTMVMDLVLFLYAHFEPSLHLNFPELKTSVERFVCAIEVGQIMSICLQILSAQEKQEEGIDAGPLFSKPFRWYMFWFSTLTVVMLSFVSYKAGVHVYDRSTRRKMNSKVNFVEYNYKPRKAESGNELLQTNEEESEESDVALYEATPANFADIDKTKEQ